MTEQKPSQELARRLLEMKRDIKKLDASLSVLSAVLALTAVGGDKDQAVIFLKSLRELERETLAEDERLKGYNLALRTIHLWPPAQS